METSTVSSTYPLSTEYASISRRLLAFVLDSLIIAIPLAIGAHILPVIGGVIVWFFYAPLMESSELRATPGKNLVGIQVTDLSGRRISLKMALLRNALKAVSFLFVFLGCFVALFTRRKQALHDIFADTIVVYGRSEQSIPDTWMKTVRELFSSDVSSSNDSGGKSEKSTLEQLERLQSLREKGALSEEEFQKAKAAILG